MSDAGPEPVYDRKEQYEQIVDGLIPGEQVVAVYDATGAGTGFIGLTNLRVIVQDRSFVGSRVAITSIPYSRIASVSVVSDKEWTGNFFSSATLSFTVSGGGQHEMTFRGTDTAHHAHSVVLHYLTL